VQGSIVDDGVLNYRESHFKFNVVCVSSKKWGGYARFQSPCNYACARIELPFHSNFATLCSVKV
jgi:hypothetical protein